MGGFASEGMFHDPIFSRDGGCGAEIVVPMHMLWLAASAAPSTVHAARDTGPSLVEFMRDPALTVACVLLVVVSLGWVVMTRLILHRMKRAARRGARARLDAIRPAKDIWSIPP